MPVFRGSRRDRAPPDLRNARAAREPMLADLVFETVEARTGIEPVYTALQTEVKPNKLNGLGPVLVRYRFHRIILAMKAVVAVLAAAVLSLAAGPVLSAPDADRVAIHDTLRGVIDAAGWPCDRVTAAKVDFKISDTTFVWDATCSDGGDYKVFLRTAKIETSTVHWKDAPKSDRGELRAFINMTGSRAVL